MRLAYHKRRKETDFSENVTFGPSLPKMIRKIGFLDFEKKTSTEMLGQSVLLLSIFSRKKNHVRENLEKKTRYFRDGKFLYFAGINFRE